MEKKSRSVIVKRKPSKRKPLLGLAPLRRPRAKKKPDIMNHPAVLAVRIGYELGRRLAGK